MWRPPLTTLLLTRVALSLWQGCPEKFAALTLPSYTADERRSNGTVCLLTTIIRSASWLDARKYCLRMNSDLASLSHPELYKQTADFLLASIGDEQRSLSWYTGLHCPDDGEDVETCPNLSWIDGISFSPINYRAAGVSVMQERGSGCDVTVYYRGRRIRHPLRGRAALSKAGNKAGTQACSTTPRRVFVTCQAAGGDAAEGGNPAEQLCVNVTAIRPLHTISVRAGMTLMECKRLCRRARDGGLPVSHAAARYDACSCATFDHTATSSTSAESPVLLPWSACFYECADGRRGCGGPAAATLVSLADARETRERRRSERGVLRRSRRSVGDKTAAGYSIPADCRDLIAGEPHLRGNVTVRNGTSRACGFSDVDLCSDRPWFYYAGGCYLIHVLPSASNAYEAASFCHAQTAEPAVVNDDAETSFLTGLLTGLNVTGRSTVATWTGWYTHKATKWWHYADGSLANSTYLSADLAAIASNRTVSTTSSYYYVKQLVAHFQADRTERLPVILGREAVSSTSTVQLCEIRRGFLGCYEIDTNDSSVYGSPYFKDSETLSSFGCVEYCRGLSRAYAAVSADTCLCLDQLYGSLTNRSDCLARCPERTSVRACSSSSTLFVVRRIADYDVLATSCEQLWNNGAYQPSWYKISVGGTIVVIRCTSESPTPASAHSAVSNDTVMLSSADTPQGVDALTLSGSGLFFTSSDTYNPATVEVYFRKPYLVYAIALLGANAAVSGLAGAVYTGWPTAYRFGYKRSIYETMFRDYAGDGAYQVVDDAENEEDASVRMLRPFVAEVIKLHVLDSRYSVAIRLLISGSEYSPPAGVCPASGVFLNFACQRDNATVGGLGCYMDEPAASGANRSMVIVPVDEGDAYAATLTFAERCRSECMNSGFLWAGVAYGQASAVIYPDTLRLGGSRRSEAYFQLREEAVLPLVRILPPPSNPFAVTLCAQLMLDADAAASGGNWSMTLASQYDVRTNSVFTLSIKGTLGNDSTAYSVEARLDQLLGRRLTSVLNVPEPLRRGEFYTLCLSWDSSVGFKLYTSRSSESQMNVSQGSGFAERLLFSASGDWRLGDGWLTNDSGDALFNDTEDHLQLLSKNGNAVGYDKPLVGWLRNVFIYNRVLNGGEVSIYTSLCELICWNLLTTWGFVQKLPGINGDLYLDGEGPLGMEDFRITTGDLQTFSTSNVFSDCDWSLARLNSVPLTADLYLSDSYHLPAWCPWSQKQRSYLIVQLRRNTLVTGFAFQGYLGRIVRRVQVYFTNDTPSLTFDSNNSATYDVDFGPPPYGRTDRRTLPYPILSKFVLFRAANMAYSLNTTALRFEIYGIRLNASSKDRQQFRNGSVCGCLRDTSRRGPAVLADSTYCEQRACTSGMCKTRAFYNLQSATGSESQPAMDLFGTACTTSANCSAFGAAAVCDSEYRACRCRVGYAAAPVCLRTQTTTTEANYYYYYEYDVTANESANSTGSSAASTTSSSASGPGKSSVPVTSAAASPAAAATTNSLADAAAPSTPSSAAAVAASTLSSSQGILAGLASNGTAHASAALASAASATASIAATAVAASVTTGSVQSGYVSQQSPVLGEAGYTFSETTTGAVLSTGSRTLATSVLPDSATTVTNVAAANMTTSKSEGGGGLSAESTLLSSSETSEIRTSDKTLSVTSFKTLTDHQTSATPPSTELPTVIETHSKATETPVVSSALPATTMTTPSTEATPMTMSTAPSETPATATPPTTETAQLTPTAMTMVATTTTDISTKLSTRPADETAIAVSPGGELLAHTDNTHAQHFSSSATTGTAATDSVRGFTLSSDPGTTNGTPHILSEVGATVALLLTNGTSLISSTGETNFSTLLANSSQETVTILSVRLSSVGDFNLSGAALGDGQDGKPQQSQQSLWWVPVLVVVLNVVLGAALYLYCQRKGKKNKVSPEENDGTLKLDEDR